MLREEFIAQGYPTRELKTVKTELGALRAALRHRLPGRGLQRGGLRRGRLQGACAL